MSGRGVTSRDEGVLFAYSTADVGKLPAVVGPGAAEFGSPYDIDVLGPIS